MRNKALAWLRADLAFWKKQAASANVVERNTSAGRLAHSLADSDLSRVREPKPLNELPTDEREKWQAFWAEVKATLAQAQNPPQVKK